MTHGEAEGRRDLAAALRQAALHGFEEGVCNHFSLVLPETEGENTRRFLINPEGLHWREMTPDDLRVCDLDNDEAEVPQGVEATAFHIHREIHRRVPRASCALHTHMPNATALCLRSDGRLKMASQNALRFYGRVSYDGVYGGLALEAEEGARIAEGLGNADVTFLANHGVVVVGPTVADAYDDLYYLERACEAQILAETGGHALAELDDETCRAVAAQFEKQRPVGARLHFSAIKRLLGSPFADGERRP